MNENETIEQRFNRKRPLTSSVLTGTIAGVLVVILTMGGSRLLQFFAMGSNSTVPASSSNTDAQQTEISEQFYHSENYNQLDYSYKSSRDESGTSHNETEEEQGDKKVTSTENGLSALIIFVASVFALFSMIYLFSFVERSIEDKNVNMYARILAFIIGVCLSIILISSYFLLGL